MVGHSKGGAEAVNSAIINANTIISSPAAVNLSAYELGSNTYTANMVAYIVEGDALNVVLGGVYICWKTNHAR